MGALDVAGLSWTSWDMIQNVRRADQAHSGTTDATRTERGFHRRGMENPQVSGHSDGQGGAPCKTVGYAFPGSNPGPATTSCGALELARLSSRPILSRAAVCGRRCPYAARCAQYVPKFGSLPALIIGSPVAIYMSSRGRVASSMRRLASCCCPEMHLA